MRARHPALRTLGLALALTMNALSAGAQTTAAPKTASVKPEELANEWFIRLNELDDELLKAVQSGDDEGFRVALEGLLGAVREFGSPLPDDSLEPSDLILPDAEATIAEVREMLRGEGDGLIPGLPV